jgi:uncharacterized membrane-anchored protein
MIFVILYAIGGAFGVWFMYHAIYKRKSKTYINVSQKSNNSKTTIVTTTTTTK